MEYSIVLFFSIILLFCYSMQGLVAFRQANQSNLISKIFHPDSLIDSWGVVAMIFFVPFLVSNGASILDLMETSDTSKSILPPIMISMLLIFITLELSQLGNLNKKNKDWLKLLIFAVTFDIISIIIISLVKYKVTDAIEFVLALGVLAFFSSFMIILFAFIGGKNNE